MPRLKSEHYFNQLGAGSRLWTFPYSDPNYPAPGDLIVIFAAEGRVFYPPTATQPAPTDPPFVDGSGYFTRLPFDSSQTNPIGWVGYKVLNGQDFTFDGYLKRITWEGWGANLRSIITVFEAGSFDPVNPIGWYKAKYDYDYPPINAQIGGNNVLEGQTVYHFGTVYADHYPDDPATGGFDADLSAANAGDTVDYVVTPSVSGPIYRTGGSDTPSGVFVYPRKDMFSRLYAHTVDAAGVQDPVWTFNITQNPPGDPLQPTYVAYAEGYLNQIKQTLYVQYGTTTFVDTDYTDAFFASLVINDPSYTSTILPMDSQATVLTAPYAAVLRNPLSGIAVRTLNPTLLAYIDGPDATMQVEFQVASDTTFGTTVFDTTLTGQVTGPVSTTVSPALTDGTFYRWRARAGSADGSVWGPWSDAWILRPLLKAGRAFGYSFENTGPLGVSYQGDDEYSYENTGALTVLVPHDREYVLENVGFEITIKPHAVDYVYEGDVSDNQPAPHVWFTWRPFGFASDVVWLYGMGLGASAAEHAGHVFIDPGPDYSTPDVTPAVTDWYEVPAGDHAYDDQRTIYPGTDAVPPNVTTQVQIVKWIAPTSIVPTESAATMLLYISTSVAVSNKVGWLMYPTLPTAVGNVARPMSSHTVMRLSAPLELAEGIEQLWAHQDAPAYLVALGRPVRMPAFSAGATSRAELGSWSTQSALAAALDVDLGATYRWLPDDTTVVAAPTLGTGVSTWVPKVGANAVRWRFDADSAPYIDPTYEIVTRLGAQTVPAMVFPGDAWAKMLTDANLGPYWTIAMVAVLHPGPDGTGTLLGTYQDTPTVGAEQLKLQLNGDRLSLLNGGRLNTQLLQNVSQRPVIIALSKDGDSHSTNLVLVDKSPSSKVTRYAGYPADAKLWLGRTSELGDLMYPAAMEVLDLVWWDHTLSAAEVWAAINKLDGIYGVTG